MSWRKVPLGPVSIMKTLNLVQGDALNTPVRFIETAWMIYLVASCLLTKPIRSSAGLKFVRSADNGCSNTLLIVIFL